MMPERRATGAIADGAARRALTGRRRSPMLPAGARRRRVEPGSGALAAAMA